MSAASPEPAPAPVRIRLQKVLASCGLGSRRACEELITDGRVTIDGQPVKKLGTTVDPSQQTVALDGQPLKIERKRYYLLNKPRGVVCTNRDPAGRPRVVDMFPADGPRIFPVGRLDAESEGLIVVTNDGDLSQKLAHPKYRIYRTYHVHVAGVPNRPTLESLKEGAHFAEGYFKVHNAKLLRKQGQSSHVEVVLTEGQNREVRRLFARFGHKVMRLKRVGFGPLRLNRVKPGEFRELTHAELVELLELVARNVASGPPRGRRPASKGSASTSSSPDEGRERSSEPRTFGRPPVAARGRRRPEDATASRPVRPARFRDDDDDDENDEHKGPHPALGQRAATGRSSPPRPQGGRPPARGGSREAAQEQGGGHRRPAEGQAFRGRSSQGRDGQRQGNQARGAEGRGVRRRVTETGGTEGRDVERRGTEGRNTRGQRFEEREASGNLPSGARGRTRTGSQPAGAKRGQRPSTGSPATQGRTGGKPGTQGRPAGKPAGRGKQGGASGGKARGKSTGKQGGKRPDNRRPPGKGKRG
ncbi:MAG: pseudouridine synthase [Planctomycetaceae bacterium]